MTLHQLRPSLLSPLLFHLLLVHPSPTPPFSSPPTSTFSSSFCFALTYLLLVHPSSPPSSPSYSSPPPTSTFSVSTYSVAFTFPLVLSGSELVRLSSLTHVEAVHTFFPSSPLGYEFIYTARLAPTLTLFVCLSFPLLFSLGHVLLIMPCFSHFYF